MLHCGSDYKVENYKDYKNRTVKKHIEKLTNQIRQIKDCSLKGEDKVKLKAELLQLLQNGL
jgi:hypothetical protein